MRWFRFYSDALEDPKVQRLPGDLFKAWVNLLCLANKSEERGNLPDVEDIAFALRLDHQKAEDALLGLKRAGLLDVDQETDSYVIHGWEDFEPPDADRHTPAYRAWRMAVLVRDQFTCQECGAKDELEGHHILRYAKDPDQRFVITNGVTLCADCHRALHAQEGR